MPSRIHQCLPDCGQDGGQFGVSVGAAPPRHYVFSLCIEQKVYPQRRLASGGVTGEPDPGARLPAGIAEHHALNGNGRPDRVGYPVQAPILARLRGLPGREDGLDGPRELQIRFLRKRPARRMGIDIEKSMCEFP